MMQIMGLMWAAESDSFQITQMTEPFAATVAAVAPILVLVGTVEANALVKRVKESEAERDAPLRAAMELIQSEGHDVLRVRDSVRELLIRERQPLYVLFRRDALLTLVLWVLWAGALTVAEMLALGWLADTRQKPEPGMAIFCLMALISGFAWTVAHPIMRVHLFFQHRKDEAEGLRRELQAFMERTESAESANSTGLNRRLE
ncbi:hypothetical protein O3S80_20605 [Streptomyces sp. Lzd4kr]|nr:hypothetical protein [Streptomyces sp. Lzd4kr]